MTEEKKRTVLTPAERVAKAERELAELRAKAEAKDSKRIAVLKEQREKLVAKANETSAKIGDIDTELESLGYTEDDKVADVELPLEGDES